MNGKTDEKAIFITLSEFSERMSVSLSTARQIASSKAICEAGISVRINPLKKSGGVRINWPLYLEFIKKFPTVSEWRTSKAEKRKAYKNEF